ncbi:uncharacterized protein PG986_000795 [Apiospora aurea]|uniref:Uncharacterized protein n=1 Tax=Apiospora aurea TaxID=335848 RepID=A0ABR1QV45_9PEZI
MDWGALGRLESLPLGPGRDEPRHAVVRLFTAALPRDVRLENLVWTDPSWDPAALGPILDRHGPSLRRLKTWSHEPWYSGSFDPAQAALNRIDDGAPSLDHLTLKVYRSDNDDNWPWDVSEAVASAPQLVTADIWLDFGLRGHVKPKNTGGRLNLTSASDIFRHTMQKKVGPVELDRLTFWVGDWERAWDRPIYEQSWVEGPKVRVDCNVLRQDDDESRTGTLEGMCRFTAHQKGGWVFVDEELGLDADGLPYRLPYTIATWTEAEQEVLHLQGEMAP